MAATNDTLSIGGLPAPEDFFLIVGLYREFPFKEENAEEILDIVCYDKPIDAHCPDCDRESVFDPLDNYPTTSGVPANDPILSLPTSLVEFYLLLRRRFAVKEFQCARDPRHKIGFAFMLRDFKISKIGQFPSALEIAERDSRRYREILEDYYDDYHRAMALFSAGYGVGAFVHLRRLVDNFLLKKALARQAESEKPETPYADRVDILKKHLPDALVENLNLREIVNRKIFELSETECLDYFPVLKGAVDLALRDMTHEDRRAELAVEVEAKLRAIDEENSERF
ncbi:MAG: hypothetical protein GF419_02400 [Ignavibacteriales bacterium]|nr:hypothetical protein [Ignavibacteriales bacterium]